MGRTNRIRRAIDVSIKVSKRCQAPFFLFVEMFGPYGLLAVWAATWATGSFRRGMVTFLVFLFAGLWLLWGVRQGKKGSDGQARTCLD